MFHGTFKFFHVEDIQTFMPDKAKSRTSHIKGRRGNAEEETRLHPNRITWRDDFSGITFINTYKDVANSAEDGCGTL